MQFGPTSLILLTTLRHSTATRLLTLTIKVIEHLNNHKKVQDMGVQCTLYTVQCTLCNCTLYDTYTLQLYAAQPAFLPAIPFRPQR